MKMRTVFMVLLSCLCMDSNAEMYKCNINGYIQFRNYPCPVEKVAPQPVKESNKQVPKPIIQEVKKYECALEKGGIELRTEPCNISHDDASSSRNNHRTSNTPLSTQNELDYEINKIYEILQIPELVYWMNNNPEIWDFCIKTDTFLSTSPKFINASLHERFIAVKDIAVEKYGNPFLTKENESSEITINAGGMGV